MSKKINSPEPDIGDIRPVSSAHDYTGLISGDHGNKAYDGFYNLPEKKRRAKE